MTRRGLRLWWLIHRSDAYVIDDAMIAEYREAGLTPASAAKLEALKGKEYDIKGAWAALRPILQRDPAWKAIYQRMARTGRPGPTHRLAGGIEGFEAQGYRGPYLVVIPKPRIVAVRQLRAPKIELVPTDDFPEFRRMVRDLAPADPPKPPATPGAPPRAS